MEPEAARGRGRWGKGRTALAVGLGAVAAGLIVSARLSIPSCAPKPTATQPNEAATGLAAPSLTVDDLPDGFAVDMWEQQGARCWRSRFDRFSREPEALADPTDGLVTVAVAVYELAAPLPAGDLQQLADRFVALAFEGGTASAGDGRPVGDWSRWYAADGTIENGTRLHEDGVIFRYGNFVAGVLVASLRESTAGQEYAAQLAGLLAGRMDRPNFRQMLSEKLAQLAGLWAGPTGPTLFLPTEPSTIPVTPKIDRKARWPIDTLTFALGPGPDFQRAAVREAFRIWSQATDGLLKFTEVFDDGHINVRFVDKLTRPTSTDEFGDAQVAFVDVGPRTFIQKATIELLPRTPSGMSLGDVDALNLALHEVGHALGLEHSNSLTSVMAPELPVPSTLTRLPGEQEAVALKDIYAEFARPDLTVSIESASKKRIALRTYLDVRFTVRNEGLLPGGGQTVVLAGSKEVRRDRLQSLEPGQNVTRTYTRLPSPGDFQQVAVVAESPAGVLPNEAAKSRAEVTIR